MKKDETEKSYNINGFCCCCCTYSYTHHKNTSSNINKGTQMPFQSILFIYTIVCVFAFKVNFRILGKKKLRQEAIKQETKISIISVSFD